MQYRRLTKEELEALVDEFATFLASNSIDKPEWDAIKKNEINKAEELIDLFSDMIFEKALTSCKYIERITETEMHTYLFQTEQAHMITVRAKSGVEVNFLESNLSEVFMKLLKDENLEVFQGVKKYEKQREHEMFDIINTGGVMSKGELYNSLLGIL